MQSILAFLALAVVLNINVSEAKLSSVIRAKSTEKYNDYKVLAAAAAAPAAKSGKAQAPALAKELPGFVKLLIGAGGIYAAFIYYGVFQEDIFHYKAKDGSQFKAAWFLQIIEAVANVVIGGLGLMLTGGMTKDLPLKGFALAGTSQVFAKTFTSLALASQISFPVVTLAKSGKMVPVMIGSILIGGSKYSLREYLQVASIILGTALVSMDKKNSKSSTTSTIGLVYIALSLTCDGITGGMQNRLKKDIKASGKKAKAYDFMFWTNAFMALIAAAVALVTGELTSGYKFCEKNPVILQKILKFGLASAIGQSFIFYTITNFDALVTTTVTTTRKIFSVLLSIFINGHQLSNQGWGGIALASAGILSEIQNKSSGHGESKPSGTSAVKGAPTKKK